MEANWSLTGKICVTYLKKLSACCSSPTTSPNISPPGNQGNVNEEETESPTAETGSPDHVPDSAAFHMDNNATRRSFLQRINPFARSSQPDLQTQTLLAVKRAAEATETCVNHATSTTDTNLQTEALIAVKNAAEAIPKALSSSTSDLARMLSQQQKSRMQGTQDRYEQTNRLVDAVSITTDTLARAIQSTIPEQRKLIAHLASTFQVCMAHAQTDQNNALKDLGQTLQQTGEQLGVTLSNKLADGQSTADRQAADLNTTISSMGQALAAAITHSLDDGQLLDENNTSNMQDLIQKVGSNISIALIKNAEQQAILSTTHSTANQEGQLALKQAILEAANLAVNSMTNESLKIRSDYNNHTKSILEAVTRFQVSMN